MIHCRATSIPRRSGNEFAATGCAVAVRCLLLAAGCTSYQPTPIDVQSIVATTGMRRLDAPESKAAVEGFTGSSASPWPPPSIDLPQAFAIALHYRPEWRVARARLTAAYRAIDEERQWPNPAISVGPGIVTNPAGAIPWLLSASLGFPIDLGGRRRAAIEAAASDIAAAAIEVDRADRAIRGDVATHLFAVAFRTRVVGLLETGERDSASAARIAAARAAAGVADASVQASADAALVRARAERQVAEGALGSARRDLEHSLGLAAGALDGIGVRLPDVSTPAQSTEPRTPCAGLAVRSWNVGLAMCAYAHAEADLHLACAEQWPDLALGPGFEYDQGLQKWKLDVGSRLPLFHGNDAAIARARAQRTAAAAAVEEAIATAVAAADRALAVLAQRRAELATAMALTSSAIEAVRLATARTAAGADDEGARISASAALTAAGLAEVRARQDAFAAWLTAELAVQSPLGSGLLAWDMATPAEEP